MRDKLLLKVMLPANRRTYEFQVPLDLSIGQAAQIISRILAAQDRARYRAGEACDLMCAEGREAGTLLGRELTLRELSVDDRLVDGSLLVLM